MRNFINKSEGLPVGAIATAVGLATLSNAYLAVGGYTGIRHITMIGAIMVWLGVAIKIIGHFPTFKGEYSQVVPSSLYATFCMLTMILGSYFFEFNETFGRGIWLAGIFLHMIHIVIFTCYHVVKGFNKETFVPSWFVTYVGILVSVVVGVSMGMPQLLQIIVTYGFVALGILLPLMVYRLIKNPLPQPLQLTAAILLAPSSLCLIGYLNVSAKPVPAIVFSIYGIIFIKLLYVASKLPQFLQLKFNPGFAALTFPLAISLVASIRMSGFLMNQGMVTLGNLVYEFSGIQLYVTTAIIAYVAYQFLKLCVQAFSTQKP